MRLYSDLDNTLINPVMDPHGNVTAILPRPGVNEFIRKLARDGDLWLLTAANRAHADRALSILSPASKLFRGVLSSEDMEPIAEQIDVIFGEPGLTELEKIQLWREIRPIAPSGVMFDDYPVDSWVYLLKGASLGIESHNWIEVEHFGSDYPDRGGLGKAYAEFRKRFPNLLMMNGDKRKKSISGTMGKKLKFKIPS